MTKKIIAILKNQGIEVDSAQLDLICEMNNSISLQNKSENRFLDMESGKKGFYIWGSVGRGKTLIAKSFFNCLKEKKISFHYIDFINKIHEELSNLSKKNNPLDLIAKSLSQKYKIIFIDEFQVEDITDAMIIGNLINKLLESNTTLYMTSNAHPDDLYKNGLQRQIFIKNMKIMQKSLNVYKLEGETDYRIKNIMNINQTNINKVFNDENIILLLEENFTRDINKEKKFRVNSKYFSCKATSDDFLWISFSDFFSEANGSKDYIKISENKNWIFLSDFKNCNDDSSDIIRRFISFIDICYRDRTKVKFFENDVTLQNIYKGDKLKILWDRCCSRIHEMQTLNYLS